jgi:hypothetical protein
MTDTSGNSGRRSGRPRKSEPPRLPYDEVDRLLVFGEVVKTESGESTTVVYPSYREIARRYGVSHSLIAQYSKRHDCLRRRKEAKARIAVKTDQKLVEMRATAIAVSKDESLQIIDTYLAGFRDALAEGRVRFDNPTDFDRMCRLKEFMLGGADSRQEIHAALSLEDLQAATSGCCARCGPRRAPCGASWWTPRSCPRCQPEILTRLRAVTPRRPRPRPAQKK